MAEISQTHGQGDSRAQATLLLLAKWVFVLAPALAIYFSKPPSGITETSWHLLGIFVGTVLGMISRPLPGGAMVLLGVLAVGATGSIPTPGDKDYRTSLRTALAGYADPTVWLVLAAFFMSRGMIKTGLGRRIALLFIRAIGRHSLGLAYALTGTDMVLGSVIPSNGARAGGIIFPITKSLAEAYESRPGPTAGRLGAFLMALVYQGDVIVCAMFFTGQASNALIASQARGTAKVDITYNSWLQGSIVPALLSMIAVPLIVYWLYPPEVKHTPAATEFARDELSKMGPPAFHEWVMLVVFGSTVVLWMTFAKNSEEYAVVALAGIALLLLAGVLTWDDVVTERGAWDVFLWYGGLVRMGEALRETGITSLFAETAADYTEGWSWALALVALLLVYFYVHYGLASITAHVMAMYIPFLTVTIAAGAPPMIAAMSLAYFSNLNASLTHYGTTPAPIFFGAGYVKQWTWWYIGLVVSIPNILIWMIIGPLWWKWLGWW